MTYQNYIDDAGSQLIGKTVYFIMKNRLICGEICDYDGFQLFIKNRLGVSKICLAKDTPFFFSVEDLLNSLKEEMIDMEKEENLPLRKQI